jgi:hypothetical protein
MKPRIPKLDNVNRIVINRVSVWERNDEVGMWYKIAGGPGFKLVSKSHEKNPDQMRSLVVKKLSHTENYKVFENYNAVVFEDFMIYRYWISEGTLNIVRDDLPNE